MEGLLEVGVGWRGWLAWDAWEGRRQGEMGEGSSRWRVASRWVVLMQLIPSGVSVCALPFVLGIVIVNLNNNMGYIQISV